MDGQPQKKPRTVRAFLATSMIIVAFVTGLFIGIFVCVMELDRSLAYMGVYFEDLGGNLTDVNASQDAVELAYTMSGKFCTFYQAQMIVMGESLASGRYAPACNASLQNTTAAADIKAELRNSPPFFGLVFSYEPKNKVCSREMGSCGKFIPANRIPWW